jgi:hypothetical protein
MVDAIVNLDLMSTLSFVKAIPLSMFIDPRSRFDKY